MKFENMYADLEAFPIAGYAPNGEYVSIPLISHIADNLYVGGHRSEVNVGDFFSHIFSFFVWGDPYTSGESTVHESFLMLDGQSVDVETIADATKRIVAALDEGGNVLVHCQAGINRSNLVAAHVLHEKWGYSYRDAIGLLRHKRGQIVLMNKTFERYLLDLDSTD